MTKPADAHGGELRLIRGQGFLLALHDYQRLARIIQKGNRFGREVGVGRFTRRGRVFGDSPVNGWRVVGP